MWEELNTQIAGRRVENMKKHELKAAMTLCGSH
jgi:hypothetical protein